MTLFEYITVAESLVLSLSIVRMLDGITSAFESHRRYSVHAAWCAIKMVQPLLIWWSIWELHDHRDWNFLAFSLCVASPAILYLQISILMPDDDESVTDWRAYFYENKSRFFRANIGLALAGPLLMVALGAVGAALILAGAASLEIALSILALTSSHERVHVAVVTITALAFAAWPILLFTPEALGSG